MSKLLLSKFITKPGLQLSLFVESRLEKSVQNNINSMTYTLRVLMQTMGIITTTASPAAVHIIHTWRTAKCLHKQEFLYHFFLFCSFSRGTKSKHSLKTWAIKIWISIFNPFLMKKNYCLKFWTFPELPDNADLHLVAFVLVVGFGKCHVGVLISVVLPITSIMEPQSFLN